MRILSLAMSSVSRQSVLIHPLDEIVQHRDNWRKWEGDPFSLGKAAAHRGVWTSVFVHLVILEHSFVFSVWGGMVVMDLMPF